MQSAHQTGYYEKQSGKRGKIEGTVPDDKDIKNLRVQRKINKKEGALDTRFRRGWIQGRGEKERAKKKYTPGEFVGAAGGSTEQFNQVSMMQPRKKLGKMAKARRAAGD